MTIPPEEEVKEYRIYGMVQEIFEYGINKANLDSLTVTGPAEAESLRTENQLTVPVYDDKANAPTDEGSIVAITGDGATTPAGIYRYDPDTPDYVSVGGVSGQDDPLAIPSSASSGASGSIRSTAVGVDATAAAPSSGNGNVAVGNNASAPQRGGVAVGESASVSTNSTAVGRASNAGNDSVAVGRVAQANALGSVVIGKDTTVATSQVARIQGNQLVHGAADGGTIANADLNNGEATMELDETNGNMVIRAKQSDGTVVTGTVSLS